MTEATTGQQAQEAATFVKDAIGETPRVAIVLGSGLSDFSENLTQAVTVSYADIPHYPEPTVPGHVGELVAGRVNSLPVLTARGRFHHYEGHDLETLVLPIHLFAELGVSTVMITNAAGCVNDRWEVGDLMLITGHLDCSYLSSADDSPVISDPAIYPEATLNLARLAAQESGITLREGVYAWNLGPTFETPAEIRHIRSLGGDAVGMSTLPEIEAAAGLGLQVIGISCLTNYAAGILDQPLNHDEVLETGRRVKTTFAKLVTAILGRLAGPQSGGGPPDA
ncbi:MAG: purine-nucleoside phosphorylase [Candidatus Marinimicrobia bacterium]|nr:purine-nucleoside phosphorylase [Candidatus Neomarinimicrobiota bacterium]